MWKINVISAFIAFLVFQNILLGVWFFTKEPEIIEQEEYTYQEEKWIQYQLKSGDTLWGVARVLITPEDDIREMVYILRERNQITDPGKLMPGEYILIPYTPQALQLFEVGIPEEVNK